MNRFNVIAQKVMLPEELQRVIHRWRLKGDKIVFTNGCFDILHKGHAEYLAKAASLGNRLIIGLNSDESVKRLKGSSRPFNAFADRAFLLASLHVCDAVIGFETDTPLELIQFVKPDILVKGGDYTANQIVGYDDVIAFGGRVEIIAFTEGYSTSAVAEKINKTNKLEE